MKEEDLLCHFAAYRMMCGQQPQSTLEYISHIRTLYGLWWRTDGFGIVGTLGKGNMSLCSRYVRSLDKLNPSKVKDAGRLLPVTIELLQHFIQQALHAQDWNMAACLVTAFQGVMRTGEITEGKDPFNANHHLTEADIQFVPNFQSPTLVMLRIGRSKSDQMGVRAILHPRDFPVTTDDLSAGARIKDLICNRYGMSGHEIDFVPNPARPLFMRGSKPLKEHHVLQFIRKAAKSFGYSPDNVKQIGTRSLRIGGATRLFQLGATQLTLQHLGGWSTDTMKAYLRSQTADFHHLTAGMVKQSPRL